MKRKLLAIITTAAMVTSLFGFAGVAAAGTFPDVSSDKSYADAVERLAGLGIFKGRTDGTFGGEDQVTRAEFAAMVVRLRGIKNAGTGATDFKDVPSTHWASGWINLATGMGIIKGMGNGNFAPDANVTHAQALTMVLRAMGYEPVLKRGTWPSNALAQAALLGVDDGVTVVSNLPATRGELAMMADNALDKPLMVLDSIGDDGNPRYTQAVDADGNATKSIVRTYLKSTSVEGVLTDSPENLGNAEKKYVKVNAGANIELVSGTKYAGLLGHKVKVWKNTDGKAFFVENKTEADRVLSIKAGDVVADAGNVTKVKVGTTEYTLADNDGATPGSQVIYIKNRAVDGSAAVPAADVAAGAMDNDKFTAILNDDGKVQTIVVTQSYRAIVDSVSTANEAITATNDWPGPGSLKDKTVTWTGAVSKLGDLKKGDVLEWLAANDKVVISVTRNNKSGNLDRIDLGNNAVRVGGTDYKVAAHTVIAGWDDNSNLGKAVTLYLDQFGKLIKLELGTSTTGTTGNPVAVIISGDIQGPSFGVFTHRLRVLKSDGARADLTIINDAVYYDDRGGASGVFKEAIKTDGDEDGIDDALNAKGVVKGNAIEYVLDANGKIEKIIVLAKLNGSNAPTANKALISKDPARIKTGDAGGQKVNGGDGTQGQTTYLLTSGTMVFDTSDGNTDNWKTFAASSLTADNEFTGKVVRDKDNTALARIVVVSGNYDAGTASDRYGLVMSRYTVSGPKCMYSVNEKGTINEIEAINTTCDLDSNTGGDQTADADQVVKFRVVGGKFDGANSGLATEDASMAAGYKIWQIDTTNNVIKVSNDNGTTTESYLVYASGDVPTQYFNLKGDATAAYISLSALSVGDKVSIWTDGEDNSVARVVVIDR